MIWSNIYNNVKSRKDIPIKVIRHLKELVVSNTIQNMVLFQETKMIFSNLNCFREKAILLKGFSISEKTNEDYTFRFTSDIDILVPEGRIAQVGKRLKELDYAKNSDYINNYWNAWDEAKSHHDLPLTKKIKDMKVCVELHNGLVFTNSPFNISNKRLWEQKDSIKLGNIKIPSLSTEHMLIHMCLQLAYQHSFRTAIRDLLDISAILKKKKIRWDSIVKDAVDWGASAFVYRCLELTVLFFRIDIPKKVLEHLRKKSKKNQLWLINHFNKKSILKIRADSEYKLMHWGLQFLFAEDFKNKLAVIRKGLLFVKEKI